MDKPMPGLRIILISLLIGCTCALHGQSPLDSMRRAVLTAVPDTNKVILLLQLGDSLHDHEPKVALDHANEALDLAYKLNWHPLTARIEEMIGYTHNQLNNYSEALVHLHRSIPLHQANGDSMRAAEINWYLSGTYTSAGDTARARIHMRRYLQHAVATKSAEHIASAYRGLGHSFGPTDPQRALQYHRKALFTAEQAQETAEICLARASLAGQWAMIGANDSALVQYELALPVARKFRTHWPVMIILIGMSSVLDAVGRYGEAASIRQEALLLAVRHGDKRNESQIHQQIAQRCFETGRIDLALVHFRSSLALAKELKLLSSKTDALRGLLRCHQRNGSRDSAMMYLDLFLVNKDSLERSDQRMELVRLTAQMEYRSRQVADSLVHANEIGRLDDERTIERLRADRNRNRAFAFGGVALMLGLSAMLLWRGLLTRKQLAKRERELHAQQVDELLHQQEIKAFNAMLEGQEKERDRVAKDLHDRLGSMLSAIKMQVGALEGGVQEVRATQETQHRKVERLLDEAVGEVRRISHDMVTTTLSRFGLAKALEDLCDSVRVSGRLAVELQLFGLEQRLERSVEITVYRIVQELVSNVLKHAQARELSISVTRETGRLSVMVTDDGKGFDPAVAGKGIGLQNVRSRAATLGATVQLDSAPGKGSTVSVECPVVE